MQSLELLYPKISRLYLGAKNETGKIALKQWATKHYQEPTLRKIEILKQMETMQEIMEQVEVTRELLLQEIELEKNCKPSSDRKNKVGGCGPETFGFWEATKTPSFFKTSANNVRCGIQ